MNVHSSNSMVWKFKNIKSTIERGKKICSIYDQGVITDRQFQNWFSKFHSDNTSLRDEHRTRCSSYLEQDALRELVEYNPHKN